MLAQVGAPDSDTGASVYRPCQWLHLFQDKDIHFYLPVNLCGLRQPQPSILILCIHGTDILPLRAAVRKRRNIPASQHTE